MILVIATLLAVALLGGVITYHVTNDEDVKDALHFAGCALYITIVVGCVVTWLAFLVLVLYYAMMSWLVLLGIGFIRMLFGVGQMFGAVLLAPFIHGPRLFALAFAPIRLVARI